MTGTDGLTAVDIWFDLIDLIQVAGVTVVFKTRARRLYDIANALAALGLIEKVKMLTRLPLWLYARLRLALY